MSDQKIENGPLTVAVVALSDDNATWRWLMAARHPALRLILVPANHASLTVAQRGIPVAHADHVARLSDDEVGVWIGSLYDDESEAVDALPAPVGHADRRGFVRGAGILRAVQALRPALVHALDTPVAGYACLAAARRAPGEMPPWLQSAGGCDLRAYAGLAEHRPVLRELLSVADAFLGDSERDAGEARKLGFAGPVLPPLPLYGDNGHGWPSAGTPPSQRRLMLVNGDQGWSGRGLEALSALHLARRELAGSRVCVFGASSSVRRAVTLLREQSGIDVEIDEQIGAGAGGMPARAADARIVVDLGVAGLGTLIEGMAAGAFPIGSLASSAGEWIRSGVNGFVVAPDDTAALAEAIVTAMRDDELVDGAVRRNRSEVASRTAARGNAIGQHYRAAITAAHRGDERQAV